MLINPDNYVLIEDYGDEAATNFIRAAGDGPNVIVREGIEEIYKMLEGQ